MLSLGLEMLFSYEKIQISPPDCRNTMENGFKSRTNVTYEMKGRSQVDSTNDHSVHFWDFKSPFGDKNLNFVLLGFVRRDEKPL